MWRRHVFSSKTSAGRAYLPIVESRRMRSSYRNSQSGMVAVARCLNGAACCSGWLNRPFGGDADIVRTTGRLLRLGQDILATPAVRAAPPVP
jgi:hypothetical protein